MSGSNSSSKSRSKARSKLPSDLNVLASSLGAFSSSFGGFGGANPFLFRPFKSSNLAIPTSPLFSPRSPLSPPPALPAAVTATASFKTARGGGGNSSRRSTRSTRSSTRNKKKKNNNNKNDGFPFFSDVVFGEEENKDKSRRARKRSSSLSPPCSPLSPSSSRYPSPPPSPPPFSPPVTPPPPPPPRPMPWMWQCHLCHRRYPLGATRRCLEDGHYFCSGVTEVRGTGTRRRGTESGSGSKTKRLKRHRPCQSEFDYDGWKAWGEWRRGLSSTAIPRETMQDMSTAAAALAETAVSAASSSSRRLAVQLDGVGNTIGGIAVGDENNRLLRVGNGNGNKKNCGGNCDYPSECRWKRQMTARTPESVSPSFFSDTPSATITVTATTPEMGVDNSNSIKRKISGTEMLLPTVFEEEDSSAPTATVKTLTVSATADMVPKDDFWKSLLASVSRRKSLSVQDNSVDLSDLVADAGDDGTRSASV